MTSNTTSNTYGLAQLERRQTLLAKLRRRQLDLAITGQIIESARYAQRASQLADSIVIATREPMMACCGA